LIGIFKNYLNRLKILKGSIVIAFLTGILFSSHLWMVENRLFPLIKPLDDITTLGYSSQLILMLIFISLSIIWIFFENRWIGFIVLGTLIVVLLQDQLRWQPWVYLYFLMLLPYLLLNHREENHRSILGSLKFIISGVYIWSGIQKLNSNFIYSTFVKLLAHFDLKDGLENWINIGYILPLIEIFIGLALLTSKFRIIGIFCAISMHVIILVYLSPFVLNHNSVVYPWNVAMIIFVLLLFLGTNENLLTLVRMKQLNIWSVIPLVLDYVFPIFSYFGYWDHYLSFSLYSDKPSIYYIAIEQTELHKVNKRLENYFAEIPGLQGGQIIDINKWAYFELNVPFYPENRVFKKLSKKFCELGIDEDKMIFLELYFHIREQLYNTFTCKK